MKVKDKKSNAKKQEQLGMPIGTASSKLKKNILFSLIQKLGLDTCFQCNKPIETVKELSVEHKEPWLDSIDPKEKFFDLDNIAFSHLSCNAGAARQMPKQPTKHGTLHAYMNRKCRCNLCKKVKQEENKRNRKKR